MPSKRAAASAGDCAAVDGPVPDLLGWYLQRHRGRHTRSPRRAAGPKPDGAGIRFAFYGRISTEDWQDPGSSGRWQRDFAEELIAGRGSIVAEFFDVGHSRAQGWGRRPQAAALLAQLADPDRGWDAVVVGEFERAFYAEQFEQMAPIFAAHGVAVWLPELDGPADLNDPMHVSLLRMLGVHSRREVQRARFRAKAAMRAQVAGQGRNLGGRPPYGYRLVDAGPHPNRAHARWGRRALRLDPDPATAPHVAWMFAQRLAGRSITAIARELNERGVPCPSQVDAERNRHRSGRAWIWQTVAAILANPRYTGRQSWNRLRTDTGSLDETDDVLGRAEARRWNSLQDWVISEQVAHPPLVSEADFVAVQAIYTTPAPADGSSRGFALSGLLFCQICGRRLTAHWVHGRAGYRCRHGHTTAQVAEADRRRNVYVRQDQVLMFPGHARAAAARTRRWRSLHGT